MSCGKYCVAYACHAAACTLPTVCHAFVVVDKIPQTIVCWSVGGPTGVERGFAIIAPFFVVLNTKFPSIPEMLVRIGDSLAQPS
ncbi:hypothetical protein BH09SUM1_BH09SUM1_18960 [soil metagenome]